MRLCITPFTGFIDARTTNATTQVTTKSYNLYDTQGNLAQTLNARNGNLLGKSAVNAWGEPIRDSAGNVAGAGYGAKFGYVRDGESGFYLCTLRYYDASGGRWLTRDPIGYAGGSNLYGYVGNDPGNAVDPSGLYKLFEPRTWFDGNGYQGSGLKFNRDAWNQAGSTPKNIKNWLDENYFSNPALLPADVQQSMFIEKSKPDYIALNGGFNIPAGPGYATQIVVNNRNGNIYAAPFGAGYGSPGFSGSLTFGYIEGCENAADVDDFLPGQSVGYGVGYGIGLARTQSNTKKGVIGATEFGFFTPQYGVSQVYDVPLITHNRK